MSVSSAAPVAAPVVDFLNPPAHLPSGRAVLDRFSEFLSSCAPGSDPCGPDHSTSAFIDWLRVAHPSLPADLYSARCEYAF